MKNLPLIFLMLSVNIAAMGQVDNPNYDKALADSLGGDEYGMKAYVLVLLKTGSNAGENKVLSDSIFRAHIDNITRLAATGKLVVAGPLGKNDKSYRGIFILNVKTINEASGLLNTDPAIKEKLLDAEMYQWYGSAALPVYLEAHGKIEKKKI